MAHRALISGNMPASGKQWLTSKKHATRRAPARSQNPIPPGDDKSHVVCMELNKDERVRAVKGAAHT
jgi:hypothetical protein